MATAADVLAGRADFSVEAAKAEEWLLTLPADSLDLVFFSPPYSSARLYLEDGTDLGIARTTEEWVGWMLDVFRAAVRACRGLVACVCDDQTDSYRYGMGPYLLMADLHRAGFNLRRPCVYRRSGIPGSGGPDWFRCDHEPIICVTRPGKLPWSDNTACGHPPKWAPGGEMSHRLTNGARVNQWGMVQGRKKSQRRRPDGTLQDMVAPSHVLPAPAPPEVDMYGEPVPEGEGNPGRDPFGMTGRVYRGRDGRPAKEERQGRKPHTKARANGTDEQQSYTVPVLANPGTVINRMYSAEEVADLLGQPGDVVDCTVGGGQMGEGDRFSRQNEAPFPEELAERFVRSFCPPGGICCDPFSGSGTTAAVAVRWGRRFVGCDLRQSQVELTKRRVAGETPLSLFHEEG